MTKMVIDSRIFILDRPLKKTRYRHLCCLHFQYTKIRRICSECMVSLLISCIHFLSLLTNTRILNQNKIDIERKLSYIHILFELILDVVIFFRHRSYLIMTY